MNARVFPVVAAILDAALRGELTETQAVLMSVCHYPTRPLHMAEELPPELFDRSDKPGSGLV